MARYQVLGAYQVNHAGTIFGPGEIIEADLEPEREQLWLLSGYVAEVKGSTNRKAAAYFADAKVEATSREVHKA